ncbi:MAG: hypothetical protein WAK18_17790 [Nocardioidaceae bacterium]
MTELNTFAAASAVASCTLEAAHRRDHDHSGPDTGCHPHTVEVVHLGERAAMVCHDCHTDSGFIPHREAWHLACDHRSDTEATPKTPHAA